MMNYEDRSMYNLYCCRREKKIRIIKVLSRNNHLNIEYTEPVEKFNDYYFVSLNKDKLKEKAEEIRQEWIREIEEDLEDIKKMSFYR